MGEIAFRPPSGTPERPERPAGTRLLLRRVGISGAVFAIVGVSAACLAVFAVALYAASLAL